VKINKVIHQIINLYEPNLQLLHGIQYKTVTMQSLSTIWQIGKISLDNDIAVQV